MSDIRQQLRTLVAGLSRRFDDAAASARVSRIGGAAADGNERGAQSSTIAAAVLSVRVGDRVIERATTDLRPDGLAAVAKHLAGAATPTRPTRAGTRAMSFGAPRELTTPIGIDPRTRPVRSWLAMVDRLHEQARRFGGSRTVYRGAYVTVEDDETLFVGAGLDVQQRLVRTRSGVLFVASTGSAAVADEATHSGILGLEAVPMSDAELDAAARRALSLITARTAVDTSTDLVLDPSVASLLALRVVGHALEADRWVSGESIAPTFLGKRGADALASARVTLIDDARGARYGSYHFDDQGQPAAATRLIDAGRLTGPLTDHATASTLHLPRTANARRSSPLSIIAPRCSNIGFAPGDATRDELLSSVHRGLLIEGGISARVDLRRWRFSIQCARAREIRNGRLTGRLYGGLVLRGAVPALLRSVRGATKQTAHFAVRDGEAHGWPGVPQSMSGPFLLAHGEVSRA